MAETKKTAAEETTTAAPIPAAAFDPGTGDDLGLDETVPGGKYKVGDEIVDANGEPIGKKKKDEGE